VAADGDGNRAARIYAGKRSRQLFALLKITSPHHYPPSPCFWWTIMVYHIPISRYHARHFDIAGPDAGSTKSPAHHCGTLTFISQVPASYEIESETGHGQTTVSLSNLPWRRGASHSPQLPANQSSNRDTTARYSETCTHIHP
jgi:hypothetical protein